MDRKPPNTLSVWANVTNDWVTASGNTPMTAYAWSDGKNWESGVAPGNRDVVHFSSPSVPCYVALSGETYVQTLRGNDNVRLLGEKLYLSRAVDSTEWPVIDGGIRVYADIYYGTETDNIPSPAGTTRVPYFGNVSCAGRVISDKWNITPAWNWTNHRLDWYATSANPCRTDDVQLAEGILYHPGSGHVAFYAPQGSDGCTGVWRQTVGSPFLERVSETAHPISVGTVVTGTGIPTGTYVRREFESNLIELSQPVTETVASNELAFAAFTPNVRIGLPLFSRQGDGTTNFKLFKYREQDTLRVEIGEYRTWGNKQLNRIGLTADECRSYVPGTHVIHRASDGGTDGLLNCHLELAGELDGKPTTFSAKRPWTFVESGATARVTVPEGQTAFVAVITNWTGRILKDGGGMLTLGMGNITNTGSLAVSEGTVVLGTTDALDDARPRLGGLRVAPGATLQIPAAGLVVESLDTAAGAVISGPGELQVMLSAGVDVGAMTLTNGATLNVVGVGVPEEGMHVAEKPRAAVVGHPAFWVDASKADTIEYVTENGVNYVTRWNDCRAGETMFCTNIARRPQFVNGDLMTNKYVRIAPCKDTEYLTNTEQMVWSVPIKDIRAVFLVQDPSDGGGGRIRPCRGDSAMEVVQPSDARSDGDCGRTVRFPRRQGGNRGWSACVDGRPGR